jgi:hypothetical protein
VVNTREEVRTRIEVQTKIEVNISICMTQLGLARYRDVSSVDRLRGGQTALNKVQGIAFGATAAIRSMVENCCSLNCAVDGRGVFESSRHFR